MRPPHDGIEICHQFIAVKWFGQITIGASAKRGNFLINAAIAGNDQYRDKDVILPDKPCQSRAITVRQVQVKKDRIDSIMFQFR